MPLSYPSPLGNLEQASQSITKLICTTGENKSAGNERHKHVRDDAIIVIERVCPVNIYMAACGHGPHL